MAWMIFSLRRENQLIRQLRHTLLILARAFRPVGAAAISQVFDGSLRLQIFRKRRGAELGAGGEAGEVVPR